MAVVITGSNTPTAGGVTYGDGTTYATTAAGSSGQYLTSAGAGAPTWTTLAAPSTSGGATVTNPMSANITLTSSSNRVQVMTPSAFGYTITLPDATTISAAGGPIFVLDNTSSLFPIKVLDSAGTNIGWVVNNYNTSIYLTSTAAATGNWVIDTGNECANGGIYPYQGEMYLGRGTTQSDWWSQSLNLSSTVSVSSNAFSTADRYFFTINTQKNLSYSTYDTSQSSGPGLAQTMGSFFTLRISDTQLLFAWQASSTNITAQVVTINANGTATAFGSTINIITTFNGSYQMMDMVLVSSTAIFVSWQNTSSSVSQRMLTLSGTTITAQAVMTIPSITFSPTNANWISLLSPTLVSLYDSGNAAMYSITISGNTLTYNGTTSAPSGGFGFGIFTASSTTSVILYVDGPEGYPVYGRVVTNNGSSFSFGTSTLLLSSSAPNSSQNYAISKLATGLGLMIPYTVNNGYTKKPYFIIGVSGGVPFVKSQGVLPSSINAAHFMYPKNGMCLLQTAVGSGNSGYAGSVQRAVITGAD